MRNKYLKRKRRRSRKQKELNASILVSFANSLETNAIFMGIQCHCRFLSSKLEEVEAGSLLSQVITFRLGKKVAFRKRYVHKDMAIDVCEFNPHLFSHFPESAPSDLAKLLISEFNEVVARYIPGGQP